MRKCLALSWGMLLMWHGIAAAQTTTAPKPSPSLSVSTSTTATTATRPANTGEIYRWVDKNGKVQYSADVPEDRRATAKRVDTRSNIVSSRVPASIGGAPAPEPAADAAPVARQPITEREKCEAAWQRYNEAQACFARFRQGTAGGAGNRARGNVAAAAQENCQNLPEPAACR
jgi:hypothetical protein